MTDDDPRVTHIRRPKKKPSGNFAKDLNEFLDKVGLGGGGGGRGYGRGR